MANPQSLREARNNALIVASKNQPISQIPHNRSDDFVSRDGIFEELNRLYAGKGHTSHSATIAIWGLGGCGKTQIAIEFGYRCQDEANCSIFWVHADSEETFVKSYNDLARKAELPLDLKGETLLNAVKEWMEQQSNWVLFLDSADDSTSFEIGIFESGETPQTHSPELMQFVPKSHRGTVIWTTRDGEFARRVTSPERNRHVEMGQMSYEESYELFRRLSGQDDGELSQHEEKLRELVNLLDRLPLAIAQAATYIREANISIKKYLDFTTSELGQSKLLGHEKLGHYGSGIPSSLMFTWLVSMEQVAKSLPFSEEVLRIIAFWDYKEIPFQLIKKIVGPNMEEQEVLRLASRLGQYSLLQHYRESGEDMPRYAQHRLVQLAMRQSLSESQRISFSGEALRIMSYIFPDGTYETWETCNIYLPHAMKVAVRESAENYAYEAPKLVHNMGMYLRAQGRGSEIEEAELKVLKILDQWLGDQDFATINAMANLAGTWDQQGRFEEAEGMRERVLRLQTALDENGHVALVAKLNLATTLRHRGFYDKAEQLGIEVCDHQKKLPRHKFDDVTISALSNLALTWAQQGKRAEAVQLEEEVLELRMKVLGEEHPHTINALSNLATSWHEQGHLDKAATSQRRILELQKKVLGERHPDTILTKANLASTRCSQGHLDEAETLEIEVLHLRKESLREKHPDIMKAMGALAATWLRQRKFKEAENLALEALQLNTEILGEKHPDAITARANLAVIIGNQPDRVKDAEEHETQVLRLQTEVLGHKHPDTLTAMGNLATTFFQQGRIQEAKEKLLKVVELRKEVLGPEHAHTKQAERDLAILNRTMDQKDQKPVVPISWVDSGSTRQGSVSSSSRGRSSVWREKLRRWRKQVDS